MAIEDDVAALQADVTAMQAEIDEIKQLCQAIYTKLIENPGAPIGSADISQQIGPGIGQGIRT